MAVRRQVYFGEFLAKMPESGKHVVFSFVVITTGASRVLLSHERVGGKNRVHKDHAL
jgi:hypothetical protein